MRVLVTGAAGYLGGRVSRGLLDDGHEVVAVLRESSNAGGLDPRIVQVRHQGSTAQLLALVTEARPDAAVHVASRFIAEHKPEDIESLITSNLLFGCQLLESLSAAGVDRLVNFGTSWQHFDGGEAENYRPATLYAATKQAFEDLAAFYADAKGLRIVTLKLSDTYGPSDPRGKLVSALRSAVEDGRALKLSAGAQRINLTHVSDVVEAARIGLARTGTLLVGQMEAFAVRGAETLSLREFVNVFAKAYGRAPEIEWGARPYRAREVMDPWSGALLPEWSARITLDQGLRDLWTETGDADT